MDENQKAQFVEYVRNLRISGRDEVEVAKQLLDRGVSQKDARKIMAAEVTAPRLLPNIEIDQSIKPNPSRRLLVMAIVATTVGAVMLVVGLMLK